MQNHERHRRPAAAPQPARPEGRTPTVSRSGGGPGPLAGRQLRSTLGGQEQPPHVALPHVLDTVPGRPCPEQAQNPRGRCLHRVRTDQAPHRNEAELMPHDSHDNDLDDFAKHVLSHIAEWGMETLRVIFVISVEYQVGEPFGMLNGYEAITGFLCDYPAPASQIELVTEALHAPHPDIPDGYHASIVVMCDPRYLCPSDYQRRDT